MPLCAFKPEINHFQATGGTGQLLPTCPAIQEQATHLAARSFQSPELWLSVHFGAECPHSDHCLVMGLPIVSLQLILELKQIRARYQSNRADPYMEMPLRLQRAASSRVTEIPACCL